MTLARLAPQLAQPTQELARQRLLAQPVPTRRRPQPHPVNKLYYHNPLTFGGL
jgi:hypothetical protein